MEESGTVSDASAAPLWRTDVVFNDEQYSQIVWIRLRLCLRHTCEEVVCYPSLLKIGIMAELSLQLYNFSSLSHPI